MNLPNKLTLFRIILVPIMVIIPYLNIQGEIAGIPITWIIIDAIFIIASITDKLDGTLARKNNQVTTFGSFIDPIADKCLTTTMFVLFAANGTISSIPVIIMLWRDIVVDGIRMIASGKGVVMSAGVFGKIKTASQMFCIIFTMLNNLPFELIGLPFADILLWFSCIISVIGGVDYYNQGKEYIWETK